MFLRYAIQCSKLCASVVHHSLTQIPSLIGASANASMVPMQNIRSKTAIYYLFSNNHLNEIVAMRFDFEDDEVSREPAGGCSRLCTATCRGLPE